MTVAGDESGILTVRESDQIVVIGVRATDRRRGGGVRGELAVSAQELEIGANDVEVYVASELPTP